MNRKNAQTRHLEMRNTAASYRWLLKDKLLSIDHMSRAMISEMKTLGATDDMIDAYLPEFFRGICLEIIDEQSYPQTIHKRRA